MGLHWAEHSEQIAAPAEECFDAITDYETFPKWQNAVEGTKVREKDRKGRGELVDFEVDGKVRKIRYTLRYHYDPPRRIWWDFIEGHGVKRIEGEYLFQPKGESTVATYRLGVDPGAGVPGPVAKRMNKQVMKRSVEDLRDEAERRHGKGGGERKRFSRSRFVPSGSEPPTVVREDVAAADDVNSAGGPVSTVTGLASEAASLGLSVAESAVRTGLRIPGKVLGRARRLLP